MKFSPVMLCLLLFLSRAWAQETENYSNFPPPMDTLYQNRLQIESADYLSVHLFDITIDHAKIKDTSHFAIQSKNDARYEANAQIHPVNISSRSRAVRVPDRKSMLVKETVIFLQVPQPLQNGKSYSVTIANIASENVKYPALLPVTFDERRQTNDNIRVNQMGYLPGQQKYAYLGQYLGSSGGMKFNAQTFDLLSVSGQSAFQGNIKLRGVRDELVGQIVYELDFSPFKVPGTYRIFVPGVGLSYPFDIGAGALNPAFVNLMRGSYHQRCGDAIDEKISRHHRPACHLDDAYLDQSVEKLNFVKPKNQSPLYPVKYGGQQTAIHGHHDAGDYGKYTTNGAGFVFSILQAMELFPDKFQTDSLGFPYSGNGVPDFIDECKWELDWLENMQDPADGGVFGVIRPQNGGYENSMPPAEAHRLFFPKDTVFTGSYAAALARASRSPLMRKYFAQDCIRYQQKAQKAWEWLEKNKTFVQYFHYGAEFEDWDERNWAAIELYAASGDEKYHRYFLENFDPTKKRWGWWGLFEAAGYATNTYAFLSGRPRDETMLQKCRQAIRDTCEKHVQGSRRLSLSTFDADRNIEF